ncbi:hypothetical protein [Nonomuraea sp. PA05]|nr:hypothetical protein [Nonomuraea sp. PA05]
MGLAGALDARNRQETIDRLGGQTFDVLVDGAQRRIKSAGA